jgi:alkylated DNA nucleotide flippase Atl1
MGEVYSGPAKEPLPWHEVINREGKIWVHLGKKSEGPKWLEVQNRTDTGQKGGRP